ncbi:MAG: hypothetical protein LBU23_08870, partial [Planctomycetota bacterium]|nr:hypothetical protein [Planctomycetota bacterium]
EIEALLPEYEVHSLCLNGAYGGGLFSDTYEIMQAAFAFIPPRARRHSVFVFGTIPSLFSTSETLLEPHFTPTRRRLFPRLYKLAGTGSAPRFGAPSTALIHRIIRPFWILRRVCTIIGETGSIPDGIDWLKGIDWPPWRTTGDELAESGASDVPDDPIRQANILDHVARMAGRTRGKGGDEEHLGGEKLAVFDKMLDFSDKHGLRFVFIALPLSEKLRDETWAYFLGKIQAMISRHDRSGRMRFLDHSGVMPELSMSDYLHVKYSRSGQYAKILCRDWPFAGQPAPR